MTQLINELISNEGACRTAPATPGLLNIGERGWLLPIERQNTALVNNIQGEPLYLPLPKFPMSQNTLN